MTFSNEIMQIIFCGLATALSNILILFMIAKIIDFNGWTIWIAIFVSTFLSYLIGRRWKIK